ncbi:hypothetical protein ACT0IR_001860, partial [Campylobacter jejuni]
KKKVVICLWSHREDIVKNQIIDSMHTKLSGFYGFNLVDLSKLRRQTIYFLTFDGIHIFMSILKEFGRNIAKNFHTLKYPKEINNLKECKKFEVCQVSEMLGVNPSIHKYIDRFIGIKSTLLKLTEDCELKFSKKYYGYKIHSVFSDNLNTILPSAITIANKNILLNSILFPGAAVKRFGEMIDIDEFTKITSNSRFVGDMDKKVAPCEKPNVNKYLGYVGIISFLLVKDYHTEEIDFEALANENIEIPEEYNFNHLIPPIELYKEIIDEYCATMDPRKLASLQKQISVLTQEKQDLQNKFQNELNSLPAKKQRLELANLEQDLIIKKLESKKLAKSLGIKMSIINPKITFIQANSAKARIQNHLSYKLGQTLIENSKSILGYIRMPYVLSYIKDKHKFEQKAYEEKIKENPNLALPPLETYPDYNEALKEKECFTYKLGEAFIKASKNWYGGGISNLSSKMCLG